MANISTDFSTWSGTAASNQPDSGDTATVQADLQAIQAALRTVFPAISGAVLPTHTELNYVDGVTSAIQTQLNAKASTGGYTSTGAILVPDDAYAVGWNGSTQVPTKNAIYDKIESILDGQAFTGDITVPDEVYGVAWDGSLEVPTKNAVYDKIQSLSTSAITLLTSQATTSGTAWNYTTGFTNAKRITISVSAFSTNGTSIPVIQIGSGAYDTTGYAGATNNVNFTNGFNFYTSWTAATVANGAIILTLIDPATNTWSCNGNIGITGATGTLGYSKALSGALTQLRLTMTNGTDAGDAGLINVAVEI